MEPLFVCEFSPSNKLLANRIRRYSPVRCIIMLIIGILFFWNTMPGVIWYRFEGIWALYGFLSIAFLAYGLFMPEINAIISMRRFKKETNKEGIYRVAFGDTIEVWQGNIRISWDYDNISKVDHLKYSYEIKQSKHLAIMVDPNGFTKGTFEEFKKFLREKRPDLKIPE